MEEFYNMKVLLVKRTDYPYKGYYSLPGGFVLEGETFEDALQKGGLRRK